MKSQKLTSTGRGGAVGRRIGGSRRHPATQCDVACRPWRAAWRPSLVWPRGANQFRSHRPGPATPLPGDAPDPPLWELR